MLLCPLLGSMAPLHLPPVAPADPSSQTSPAAAWGPQDICLEKSVLRRVQMGHGNKMNLNSAPAKDPTACSPSISPPGNPACPYPTPPHPIHLPTGQNLGHFLLGERHDGKFLSFHRETVYTVEQVRLQSRQLGSCSLPSTLPRKTVSSV